MGQRFLSGAQKRQKLAVRDAFAGRSIVDFDRWLNFPTVLGHAADVFPCSRGAVADVVPFAGDASLQSSQTDGSQVFDVNEVDVFSRGTYTAALDPVEGIPAWAIYTSYAQDDGSPVSPQKFFAFYARLGQVDGRCFVDPGWRVFT